MALKVVCKYEVMVSFQCRNSEDFFTNVIQLIEFFIQWNFTGPITELEAGALSQLAEYDKTFVPHMILDGESIVDNVRYPGVLYIAKRLLDCVDSKHYSSTWWWKIRINFLHQRILEEKSTILWKEIQDFDKSGDFQVSLVNNQETLLATLYFIELAHIYLFHYDLSKSKELITSAAASSGIEISLAGK